MAAGTSIFTLMGSIMVDSDKANSSIQKTEGLAGKLSKGFGTAAKAGAVLAGVAIAGGTALFAMATKAADTTDRIDKLSQKIGISREAFQEYDYILSQNGVDVEKLQVGMKTLTQRMQEATEGTGIGAEAFDKLGLSAIDLEGNMKSQEQMFEESAKALMAMPEGAEKSQLAFELFGKAGVDLMPMLNGSAEGFDELKQAAHDMGLIMSDEAVDAGVLFTDSLDNIKRSLGTVVANIGVELMPMFQKMMDWVMENMPQIKETMGIVFEKIGEFVNIAIAVFRDHLLPIFVNIFEWVQENWPTIATIIKAAFDTVKFVWDNVLSPVLTALWEGLKVIIKWVSENWGTISSIFETVFDAIVLIWENILSPVLTALWEGLKKVVDFVANYFSGMQKTVENVFSGISKAVDAVADTFKWLVDKIEDAYDWLTKWNNKEVAKKVPSYSNFGGIGGGFAVGTRYLPNDMLLQAHEGEMIVPKSENPYANSSGQILPTRGNGITVNINGANVMDDYGVDRLMDRVMDRMAVLGVR